METAPMQATSSSERPPLAALLSSVAPPSVRSVPCASVDDVDEPPVAAEANGTQQVAVVIDRSSTAMTAAVLWSDLPGDLLGVICGMVPTSLDRVRLAAVCGQWRAALASRRPPPLPWILFSPRRVHRMGTVRLFYSPEDGGAIIPVSLPSLTATSQFLGSHDGGWIATFEEGGCRLASRNVLSGAEATLSSKQKRLVHVVGRTNFSFRFIRKLIFSEAPTSRGCILAAITAYWTVALCRIGCAKGKWEMVPYRDGEPISDIAFCNGELYGLMVNGTNGTEGLIRYEVSVGDHQQGPPVVTAARRLFFERRNGAGTSVNNPGVYVSYIFDMKGMPAMVVRAQWSGNHESSFRVFKLVAPNVCGNYNKWVEVMSLGDYALFVGPATSCKMIHISPGRHGRVEANHVYYLNHTSLVRDQGDAVCMNAKGVRVLYSSDKSVDDDGAMRRIMFVVYYVVDHRTDIWILSPNSG